MSGVPECLSCGTCCFSRLDTYVPVSGDDHARLGDRADEHVSFDGYRMYMAMEDGHCRALHIDPVSRRFVCGVYEHRPQTCRDLARGSPACRGEIETKHERPLLAVTRRRATDR